MQFENIAKRELAEGALHERYLAELATGKPEADVLWASAMDLQMGLVPAGRALPHRNPEAHALREGAVAGLTTSLEIPVTGGSQ